MSFLTKDLGVLSAGREKLELGEVRIKVVLEADGTQVEDPEYFCTLPENTVFLLLRQGEHWYPAGVEVLRQGSYHSTFSLLTTLAVCVCPSLSLCLSFSLTCFGCLFSSVSLVIDLLLLNV